MALAAINVNIGTALADGTYRPVLTKRSAPDFATVTTDLSTVSDDVATLVADGATPTQAHVTTLDTDFTALNTAYTALTGSLTVGTTTVTVIWDGGSVTTLAGLKAALDAVYAAAKSGYGGLT